jgi:hypothetical protein
LRTVRTNPSHFAQTRSCTVDELAAEGSQAATPIIIGHPALAREPLPAIFRPATPNAEAANHTQVRGSTQKPADRRSNALPRSRSRSPRMDLRPAGSVANRLPAAIRRPKTEPVMPCHWVGRPFVRSPASNGCHGPARAPSERSDPQKPMPGARGKTDSTPPGQAPSPSCRAVERKEDA